ncbi:MAG: AlkZ family DNA glycosylase [Burkholderiales bacterium]|nr:AlkZ family DNA glycosylase [Anaerolineae bacterium]
MLNIIQQRLTNQQLAGTRFQTPAEIVSWLGAVQSQDYPGAKWAVGQRLQGITDTDLDQALADGNIIRTHVLRPTWHFVTSDDIGWMLALTAPRVMTLMSYYYRQIGLDDTVFARCNEIIARALAGGKQMTRAELTIELERAGLPFDAARMGFITGQAELNGVICSGALRGKQQTYALLSERAPHARRLERDEALAELALRYFTGHGPATLKDYVWWSGLTTADARAGIEMVKQQLTSETVDAQTYWFSPSMPTEPAIPMIAYLLPNYDEYLVGYADRSAAFDTQFTHKLNQQDGIVFNNVIVLEGLVVGTWKRTLKKNTVIVETNLFRPLTAVEDEAVNSAAQRYGDFLGLTVQMPQVSISA